MRIRCTKGCKGYCPAFLFRCLVAGESVDNPNSMGSILSHSGFVNLPAGEKSFSPSSRIKQTLGTSFLVQIILARIKNSQPNNMSWSFNSQASSSSNSLASSSPPSSPDILDRPNVTFSDESPPGDTTAYVMVIGGLGYIGSHTTLELLIAGYNVVVVDDLSNAYDGVLDRIKKLASNHYTSGRKTPILKFHRMDYKSFFMSSLLSRYAVPSSEPLGTRQSRITGVIHFAAFKSVEESIHKPLEYYLNNVCGLVQLLSLLRDNNIKNFVFSSSATVYGIKANEGNPLCEEDLVHHPETIYQNGEEIHLLPGVKGLTSPYGRTKYFAEAILADVGKADPSMRITALRYFNPVGCHPSGILGEDPRQKPTNLFPVIAQVLSGSKPELEVFGSDWHTRDGTAVRDFIHVVDLARGHVAALAAATNCDTRESFRAYNLGTGNGSTVSEVISAMEMASSQKLRVHQVGRRDGDVGFCVAATRRAEKELRWRTQMSLAQCAGDTWRSLCFSGAVTQ